MGDNCCSSLLGSHEQGFQEDKGRFIQEKQSVPTGCNKVFSTVN